MNGQVSIPINPYGSDFISDLLILIGEVYPNSNRSHYTVIVYDEVINVIMDTFLYETGDFLIDFVATITRKIDIGYFDIIKAIVTSHHHKEKFIQLVLRLGLDIYTTMNEYRITKTILEDYMLKEIHRDYLTFKKISLGNS